MKYVSIGLLCQVYVVFGGCNSLLVMFGEVVVVVVVFFVVVFIWVYFMLCFQCCCYWFYVVWMMFGVGMVWVGWLIFGVFSFVLKLWVYLVLLQSMLLFFNVVLLFGVLNICGVVVGVWLVGCWVKKCQLILFSMCLCYCLDDEVVCDVGIDSMVLIVGFYIVLLLY